MRTYPREASGGPVIDLGVIDLGPARPEPAPPAAPLRPRPVRGTSARLRRWWPPAALSVLLVASTAAAAPATGGLGLAFTVDTDPRTAVALTDQTLYVATGTPAGVQVEESVWRVDAYRLRDGARLWSVPHEDDNRRSSIAVTVVDGVPLVTGWRTHTAQMSQPAVDVLGQTTAYHPRTGQPMWTEPGFVAAADGGRVVLDLVEYTGSPPDPLTYRLAGVEVATGRVQWRHEVAVGAPSDDRPEPVAGAWTLSTGGRHLVTLGRDGRLAARDLAAGTETVHQLDHTWFDASVVVDGNLLRVSMLRDRRRTFAVFDLDPLRHRWTLPDRSVTAALAPCGPVLCLRTGDGLRALDPQTGNQRWPAEPRWHSPTRLPPPWPEGLVQLAGEEDPAGLAQPDQLLVDAATGQVRLDLGAWRAYDAGRASAHPYPVVSQRGPGAHRPGHPHYDPGRLWLGRVLNERGQVAVLGSLDQVRSCELGARHAACVSTRQRVEVWQIH